MPQPIPGQPFYVTPGLRLSLGDLDATVGTDAYNGVIVLEGGVPGSYIVDSTAPFDLKAYFKTALGGAADTLPAAFSVEFHIRDLAGDPVAGSPFAGGALVVPDVPAGASAATPPDVVTWHSSSVTIPAGTLAVDTSYRITVDGNSTDRFAVHDFTIIHTED